MDLLFYRYRHVVVLAVAILAQLGLLAYQVRTDSDVRLIRVWAVSAVAPMARVLDSVRSGTANFIADYLLLINVRRENQRLKKDLDSSQLELQRLRAELATGERAQALVQFQKETPMKTVPARIFMNSTGSGSTVFVDVGSARGIERGMPVITPAGIVGKVTGVYPTASMVLLINDPLFAAGVVSQKTRVQGTLRGQGSASPIVDFVQNEQTVEAGEWFYTSGNDFVFPRGLRVGTVAVVKDGLRRKEIEIKPSGFDNGAEEVLIVTSGVHLPIPAVPAQSGPVSLQSPPPDQTPSASSVLATPGATAQAPKSTPQTNVGTDADKIVEGYRASGTVKSAPRPSAPAPAKPAPAAPTAQSSDQNSEPSVPAATPPASSGETQPPHP